MTITLITLCLMLASACGSDDSKSKKSPKPKVGSEQQQQDEKQQPKEKQTETKKKPEKAVETTEIDSEKKVVTPVNVIYHCQFGVNAYTKKLTGHADTPCLYGYRTEPGEKAPKIHVLKKYAPGSPLYNDSVLRKDNFELGYGNAGLYQLNMEFYKPPFGSLTACHTIKIDAKWGASSGTKSSRLVFNRHEDSEGNVTWVPKNPQNWPAMEKISSFYKNGPNEEIDVFMLCDWLPRLEDIKNKNLVEMNSN